MLISLFDFEGNQLGYTDKIISMYQSFVFCGIGSGEFHLNPHDPLCEIITENKYLILEHEGGASYIVVGSTLNEDFTVYCRSLSWLLSKSVLPPLSISGNLSDIIEELVSSSHGGDIKMGNIPDFENSLTFKSSSSISFSKGLEDFLSGTNLGYALRFSHDDFNFYLDILKGEALDFYISERDETLKALTLNSDILDMANSVCYPQSLSAAGTWDPRNNSPRLLQGRSDNMGMCYRVSSSEEGYTKFDFKWYSGDYIYCDTSDGMWKKSVDPPPDFYIYNEDTSVDKKYRWFFCFGQTDGEEALKELEKKTQNNGFSAEAKNIRFSEDYNLGDFVALQYMQNNAVKTVNCQFTEISVFKDSREQKENPVLKEV